MAASRVHKRSLSKAKSKTLTYFPLKIGRLLSLGKPLAFLHGLAIMGL